MEHQTRTIKSCYRQSREKETELMFWGVLPHFAEDEHYKYKAINAKAETVDKLPTFH
jgi:putative SOS response-associated peptidase YedK